MTIDARSPLLGAMLAAGMLATGMVGAMVVAGPALAKQPADLAGSWTLSFDKTGASCRLLLRADKSDKGDYFLGMPPACRHAMPGVATVGRWAMPDDTHLTLDDPSGQPLLSLEASGEGFMFAAPAGTYRLQPVSAGRSAAGFEVVTPGAIPVLAPVAPPAVGAAPPAAVIPVQAATRRMKEPAETVADLAGRYAILRDKRDTGCMLTLDKTHGKGGERAQLAPGCRDQGIVIFDPSAWSLVRGDLILTARAGHKTKLEKQGEGVWAKDPKEGGKPLGLKKL